MFLDVITISFQVWVDVVLLKHPAPRSHYPVFTLEHTAPPFNYYPNFKLVFSAHRCNNYLVYTLEQHR